MIYLHWFLVGMTGVLVIFTLLPLSKVRFGAIRGLAFPRLQMFWIALVLGVAAVFVREGGWIIAALLSVALAQMAYIVKFTPIWTRQSVAADAHQSADLSCQIAILTANVKKSNRDYGALSTLVRKTRPDIVLAIEVDEDWIEALETDLRESYPHWISVPKDTGYGMCVISKLVLSDEQVREIVTEGVPSVRTAVTLENGEKIRLYVVHPEPPVIDHDTKGRDSEIAFVGIEASQDRLPAVVSGDLNDVAWSSTTRSFQRLSGLLDPRVGRGFFNTFSAFHWWARWPLDHLFHDPQFRLLEMARLEKIGSDHFPMFFKLALAKVPDQNSDTGTCTPEERGEIVEMIKEEKNRDRGPIGTDWED